MLLVQQNPWQAAAASAVLKTRTRSGPLTTNKISQYETPAFFASLYLQPLALQEVLLKSLLFTPIRFIISYYNIIATLAERIAEAATTDLINIM